MERENKYQKADMKAAVWFMLYFLKAKALNLLSLLGLHNLEGLAFSVLLREKLMCILYLGKCVLVSRPGICFVSMEFTLHGAVKLNTITGFSKTADNLLVIKIPVALQSACAEVSYW